MGLLTRIHDLRNAVFEKPVQELCASLRELERIKKERAAEAAKKEMESREEAAAEHESSILQGNPLLDPTRRGAAGGAAAASHAVKRRWDDDVVFKNQAREPKKEARRFINDTVRNDFHRRFLNKYVV